MTRPMPEPPYPWECICVTTPESQWTTHYGLVDPATMYAGHDPGCPEHGDGYPEKRLSDAECAAEYWRADADYQTERLAELSMRLRNLQRTTLDDLPAAPLTVSETRAQARRQWGTWHRFANTPHALEES